MNVVAVVAVAAEAVPVAVAVAVAVSAAAAVAVAVAVAAAVAVPGAIFGLKVPAMVECRLCRLWLRPRVGRVNAPRVRLQHGGVYEGGGGGETVWRHKHPNQRQRLGGPKAPLRELGPKGPRHFHVATPLWATSLHTCSRAGEGGGPMCSAYTLMFCPGAARAQREGLAAPCAALGSGAGRARHTAVLPRASAPGWWTGQCLAWRTELPVRLAVRRRRRRRRELGARAYYARPRWPMSPVHEPRLPPPVRLRARGKRPNNSTPGTSRAPVRRGPKRELRAPRRQAPRTALAPPRGRR
jgi:hypothetical protein